ncbi:Nif3-like dinuclear metal center hexameric protein [Nakamurella sp. GG22]
MIRLQDVLDVLETAYPPDLAEDWDTGIGLTCGDPSAAVDTVLVAVDADAVTVDEAISAGAQLLLTHHPLLFRPVQTVAAPTAKGTLIHRMIRAGVAHYAAHTNADAATGGVNDALADALGLADLRPLVPHTPGAVTGSGRVGRLPQTVALSSFLDLVAGAVPATVGGIRAAGDPDRQVSTVALCGGAGDGFLDDARSAGADVYLTSDLRHHVVAEFVGSPGAPAVVEVAHWAGEWPWVPAAAALLGDRLPAISTVVSHTRTDPWTLHAGSPGPATG